MNPRTYGVALLGLVALEGVSIAVFRRPTASLVVLAIAAALAFVLGLRSPRTGILALASELVFGSKGYLVFADLGGFRLSLRYALFIGFFFGFALRCLLQRVLPTAHLAPYRPWLLAFAGAYVLAVVLGLAHKVSLADVFLDANGFLFFLLLVPFGVLLPKDRPRLLSVVLAGATMTAVQSYAVLAWFAHGPAGTIPAVYHWVRDTGLGEISPILGNVFRVFFQSQVYSLIASLVALAIVLPTLRERFRHWSGGALGAAVVSGGVAVSLSRSFWVGAAVGTVALVIFGRRWFSGRSAVRFTAILVGFVLFHAFLSSWALNFPFPLSPQGQGGGGAAARVANLTGESAVSSRLELLPALGREILRSPLWGYGFGHTVTYTSNDPRVRQQNPSGRFTTYTFEWGYLDQLVKFGLFGTIPFLALWVLLVRNLIRRRSEPLVLGALAATLALLAVHITSPYLGHPLGLGWFAIAHAFLGSKST